MATVVSSGKAMLAMLTENDPSLKLHALSNLNTHAEFLWPEISTSIPLLLVDFSFCFIIILYFKLLWFEFFWWCLNFNLSSIFRKCFLIFFFWIRVLFSLTKWLNLGLQLLLFVTLVSFVDLYSFCNLLN